jgi:VCBS repeat-containing protein
VTISPTNATPVTKATVGTPNATTGVVTGSVTATDADKDPLTFAAPATTAKGSVTVNARTGAFTYTPTATARHAAAKIGAATAAKTDTFTVTVTDGYGGTVPVAVSVAISPKNAVPVAGTTTVGTPDTSSSVVTGKVNATDADSDALTFSTAAKTTKGSVSLNTATGAFTYTPSEPSRAVPGTDTFTVTITDGYGGSTPVAVSVPIIGKAQQAKLTFVFNYGTGSQYWTSTAKSSLQTAANLVGSYIVVSKPVTLVFDVTAEKSPNSATLASAGSDLTSASAGFFNTVVQNKILTGVDSNGAVADGYIDVNLGIAWAFGDSVSGSQYDFVSTAMHELLHSFGFLSYVDAPGSSWNSRGTNWTKFDSFIVNKNKTKVIGTVVNRNRWNTAYNSNLTGGNAGLYFGGPNAIAVYGGPVPLYTPSPWEAGSSVTHLNDSTFTGVATQLMNALADTGKGIRTLSAVELAIFKDLGYTVVPAPVTATALLFIGLVFLRRRPQ